MNRRVRRTLIPGGMLEECVDDDYAFVDRSHTDRVAEPVADRDPPADDPES